MPALIDATNTGHVTVLPSSNDVCATTTGYGIGHIPSTYLGMKFGIHRWFAFITTAWGVVAMFAAMVHNAPGLYWQRAVLGLAGERSLWPSLRLWMPTAGQAVDTHKHSHLALCVRKTPKACPCPQTSWAPRNSTCGYRLHLNSLAQAGAFDATLPPPCQQRWTEPGLHCPLQ